MKEEKRRTETETEKKEKKVLARCDGETTLADLIEYGEQGFHGDIAVPRFVHRSSSSLSASTTCEKHSLPKLSGYFRSPLSFKTIARPISRHSRSRRAEQSSVLSKSRDPTNRSWFRKPSEPFWRLYVMELDGKVQVWGILGNEKRIWLSTNL